jgi:hypothetical protein
VYGKRSRRAVVSTPLLQEEDPMAYDDLNQRGRRETLSFRRPKREADRGPYAEFDHRYDDESEAVKDSPQAPRASGMRPREGRQGDYDRYITTHMRYYSHGHRDEYERRGGYGGSYDELSDQPAFNYGDLSHAWNTRFDQQSDFRKPGPFAGVGPKGYLRGDDAIKEEVSLRLYEHGDIDASEIVVQVTDGVVRLEGTVADHEMRELLPEACEHILGMRELHNAVRVRRSTKRAASSAQSAH